MGKFEGEPAWVPYFYEIGLDGGGDPIYRGEECIGERFKVDADHRAKFPELKGKRSVTLWYRSDGFVTA